MPRHYRPKTGARPYNKTPTTTIAQAIAEFKSGMSQRKVCAKFGIARSSFQNHLKVDQGNIVIKKPGGQTVISAEIESALVDHLLVLSDWGFPFDTMDLRMNVKRILEKEGRTVQSFMNNVPGEGWVSSFMERHKDKIKNRLCQNISRKSVTIPQSEEITVGESSNGVEEVVLEEANGHIEVEEVASTSVVTADIS